PVGLDVADPDLGPLGREAGGDRRSDAARSAGDKGLSSLEPHDPHDIHAPRVDIPDPPTGPRLPPPGRLAIDSRAMSEAIPIIGGTGALGAGLATRWARAGESIVLGSRSAERADEAA